MMKWTKFFFLVITFLFSKMAWTEELPSISGISSGGFMAAQMSVIYSDQFSGVGTVAGGFYFCAQNYLQDKIKQNSQPGGLGTQALYRYDVDGDAYKNYFSTFNPLQMFSYSGLLSPERFVMPSVENPIRQAVGICMSNPKKAESPKKQIDQYSQQKLIASPKNIKKQRVFLFHGKADSVLNFQMLDQMKEFYRSQDVPQSQIQIVEGEGSHNFPTDKANQIKCSEEKVPYVASCGVDLAGKMLSHLLFSQKDSHQQKAMLERGDVNRDHIYKVSQKGAPRSLSEYGYLVASPQCLAEPATCRLHVALHGCKMTDSYDPSFDQKYSQAVAIGFPLMRTKSETEVGSVFLGLPYIEQRKLNMGLLKFVLDAGYAEYVEKNQLMILFPQTWITEANYPYNPKGCWDWFGWTGSDYANQKGPEASWLMNFIQQVQKNPKSVLLSERPDFEALANAVY